MRRFDIRKVRKLGARERYCELYFWWREAEHMIASSFPQYRRYGRRLKRRIEGLFHEWFGGVVEISTTAPGLGLATAAG